MITVGNFRIGFATNSSSSHSIVFFDPWESISSDHTSEFGWSFFTLTDEKDKLEYLNQLIISNTDLPGWMQMAVASAITGKDPDPQGYIDHDSIFSLPSDWEGKGIDEEFLKDLKRFFKREDVAILGGNDNTTQTHDLYDKENEIGPLHGYRMLGVPGEWVGRKDGKYWTMFNRSTGNKVKISFSRDQDPPERSIAPELIDVKITDYCPYGCEFCYQGSTKEGQHGTKDLIRGLARECKESKVFEVALGGGEPTLHPEFEDILWQFRYQGVVPNFTTKNLSWLRDDKKREPILEHAGSFAYSVTRAKEVKDLATTLDYHGVKKDKVNVHYVMGTTNKYLFKRILKQIKKSGLNATLLGYKTTGRGDQYEDVSYDWWIDAIKDLSEEGNLPEIGIDTVLANQYKAELEGLDIPSWLYYLEEGKHSMYVDIVNKKFAASSFVEKGEYKDLQIGGTSSSPRPNLKDAWGRVEVR